MTESELYIVGSRAMDQESFSGRALLEIPIDDYSFDCFEQHKDKRDVVEKGKSCCTRLHHFVVGLTTEIQATMLLLFLCYPCRYK